MAGRTVRPFTTSVVLGMGKGPDCAVLKIPGYEELRVVWARLGRVRTTSPVFAATKLKTLEPTSYRPRVETPVGFNGRNIGIVVVERSVHGTDEGGGD
jgi:hypothetical protein